MLSRREFIAAMATTGVASEAQSRSVPGPWAGMGTERNASSTPSERPSRLPEGSVQVGGEMGRRIDITVKNNLLALNAEQDFLQPLREHKDTDGYWGIGKLIDASVQFAKYTGDPEVLKFKDWLVTEVLKTQGDDGYIGYLTPANRMWALWDLSEMGYIVFGLSMNHRLYGDTASLAAAKKLADYIIARWTAEPHHVFGSDELNIGMPEVGTHNAFFAIYQETQDAKYLAFLRDFLKMPQWDEPIVLGRWGKIQGHVYTYLAQCVAQLRVDSLHPSPRLPGPTGRAMEFMLHHEGMTITGACGDHECWHDTQEGTINLGETCASVYALFWLDELMRRKADPVYGDLMERLINNTLFGAQSPEGRRLRYYTAFDGPRHYFEKDTYCCPSNYRRGIAMLPNVIYYRLENGLVVNLYTASQADVALEGGLQLHLQQETSYPASGQVVIKLNPSHPAEFPLWLRIPAWCREPRVSVNGETVASVGSGRLLNIHRQWKPGDEVGLDLPMTPNWVKGRRSQVGRVALMHGPQVYCLNPSRNPEAKGYDPRLIVIEPATLEGPIPDASVRPGGLAFRVKAWKPGGWYPFEKTEFTLTLSEFPDPDGEATFFKVPNPGDSLFVSDPLLGGYERT